MRWILVTGLPATGKTTLSRLVAMRYQLPVLAKDVFKEQLLQDSGTVDVVRSRELSNLGFSKLFAELGMLALAGRDVLLDGNFRAGEHEAALHSFPRARIAQVLCRCDESLRLARIAARAGDPARHPGHADARVALDASNDAFLDLPGERLLMYSDASTKDGTDALLDVLDRWWRDQASS